MKKNIDITVIVPVYNAASFLPKCIDSLISQYNTNLQVELILVNDGSTDNSLDVINTYVKKYDTIRVLNQKNQRQGQARNYGVTQAKGKYVWFVDADDWVDSKSFYLLEKIIYKNYDIIDFESADVLSNGRIVRKLNRKHLANKVISGIDLLKDNLSAASVVTRTLYKRSFLLKHKLTQLKGVFHEDVEFAPRAYFFAETVFVLNSVLYYVRQNKNSTTRSFHPEKAFDLIKVCLSLDLFIKRYIKNPQISSYYSQIIGRSINSSLVNALDLEQNNQKKYVLLLNQNIYLLDHFIKSKKMVYIFEGIILKLYPIKILKVYKFLRLLYK